MKEYGRYALNGKLLDRLLWMYERFIRREKARKRGEKEVLYSENFIVESCFKIREDFNIRGTIIKILLLFVKHRNIFIVFMNSLLYVFFMKK